MTGGWRWGAGEGGGWEDIFVILLRGQRDKEGRLVISMAKL